MLTSGPLNLQKGTRRKVPDLPLKSERVSIVAWSEIQIECDSLAEEDEGLLILLGCIFVKVPQTALKGFPTIKPFRRLAQHSLLFGLG